MAGCGWRIEVGLELRTGNWEHAKDRIEALFLRGMLGSQDELHIQPAMG